MMGAVQCTFIMEAAEEQRPSIDRYATKKIYIELEALRQSEMIRGAIIIYCKDLPNQKLPKAVIRNESRTDAKIVICIQTNFQLCMKSNLNLLLHYYAI